MTLRLEYWSVAPQTTEALLSVNKSLDGSVLGAALINLIYLRVSQINGCSYCVDLHARDLRKVGETDARIDGLAGWYDSPLFPTVKSLYWSGRRLSRGSKEPARRTRPGLRCASTLRTKSSPISPTPLHS